jgi:hypothetical protein
MRKKQGDYVGRRFNASSAGLIHSEAGFSLGCRSRAIFKANESASQPHFFCNNNPVR